MIKSTLILSIKLFSTWILLLTVFVLIGRILFGGLSSLDPLSLANWDGRHFLEIAQFGYVNKIQYAFFPLYPTLIRIFSKVIGLDYLYCALLINIVSTFGVIFVFLKFLKEYKYENPIKTLIFFLIFPTSFYLICTYSESLFLLFSLITFYLAGKRKFIWAALFASLAAITRIVGVAVILGLILEVLLSKTKLKDKIAVALISPLLLICYCLFLYFQTGNPFYFLVSELSWGRGIAIPGANLWATLQYIAYFGVSPESFTLLSDLIFTVLGLGLGLRAIKFLKPSLSLYTWGSLLLPLTTSLLLSVPRFLIVIFPIFILLGMIKNRVFQLSLVIVSLVLLFLYFNFFIRNIWVS